LALHRPEVVLCDVRLPDGSGVEFVKDIKKLYPCTEVVLLTAYGNISDGVLAIKNGAFDYITKGDDNPKIIPLIAKAMESAVRLYNEKNCQLTDEGKHYTFEGIVGNSPAIQDAISLAKKVSQTDVPVLLTGETAQVKRCLLSPSTKTVNEEDSRFWQSTVLLLVGSCLKVKCLD